jgi:hypothetical protein
MRVGRPYRGQAAGRTLVAVMTMADEGWSEGGLWARWVAANSLAETVGLGVTAAVAVALAALGAGHRPAWLLVALVGTVLAGAFEGAVVGYAQWRVLRVPLPELAARPWVVATVVGALVAWTLGMLPTTLMGMGGEAGAEPAISDAAQLLLAATLGLLAGPVLGVPQWLVLRRFVPRASWWIVANAVAWAAGMPLIFVAAGLLPAEPTTATIVAAVLAACAAAGAVVGAVHGVWLVTLLRFRRLETASTTASVASEP